MKSNLILIALLLITPQLAIAKTVTNSQASQSDIATLENLNSQWLTAYKTKDVKVLNTILSDDFVAVRADGLTSTKADILKTVARADRFVTDIVWTNLKIKVWKNTAMVSARSNGSGTDKGEKFTISNEYADFYERTKTGWRAVGAHIIRVAEPVENKKP